MSSDNCVQTLSSLPTTMKRSGFSFVENNESPIEKYKCNAHS